MTDPTQGYFQVQFGQDKASSVSINANLGTVGAFDGLTQFGGASTVAPGLPDGYAPGWLSSLSVDGQGVLEGVFTNGVRRGTSPPSRSPPSRTPPAWKSIGGNYFQTSTNSGDPIETKAQSGGTSTIDGGSLEKSNVNTATEFVNLIQAQNGYQANARTIKVAEDDMLHALTQLIQ